jgi:bifunctional non-homologous end joining protein LigD
MTSRTSGAPKPVSTPAGPLAKYWAKRDFNISTEPRGEQTVAGDRLIFVIQKHAASSLHYDFRLELDGVLLSWAIPKGPSLDPADKRLAVRTEDHPMSYASFEGVIPPKQYGAGTVIVWDNGSWEPIGDPREGLADGKLMFVLHGQKLGGLWELVNITKTGAKQEQWLLFKRKGDKFVCPRSAFDVVTSLPESVIAKPLRASQTTTSVGKRAGMAAAKAAPAARKKAPEKSAARKRA